MGSVSFPPSLLLILVLCVIWCCIDHRCPHPTLITRACWACSGPRCHGYSQRCGWAHPHRPRLPAPRSSSCCSARRAPWAHPSPRLKRCLLRRWWSQWQWRTGSPNSLDPDGIQCAAACPSQTSAGRASPPDSGTPFDLHLEERSKRKDQYFELVKGYMYQNVHLNQLQRANLKENVFMWQYILNIFKLFFWKWNWRTLHTCTKTSQKWFSVLKVVCKLTRSQSWCN